MTVFDAWSLVRIGERRSCYRVNMSNPSQIHIRLNFSESAAFSRTPSYNPQITLHHTSSAVLFFLSLLLPYLNSFGFSSFRAFLSAPPLPLPFYQPLHVYLFESLCR